MVINWFCFVTAAYKQLAEKNKANWREFLGQDVEIVDYPDQGDWELNCLQRPIQLYKRATFSSSTGLLDADVVFKRTPSDLLTSKPGYDVILYKTGDKCLSRYFSAGAVVFYPTPGGVAFLKRWSDECKANNANSEIGLREQYFLYVAWEHTHPHCQFLTPEYCVVPPKDKEKDFIIPKNTVIYHYPASRLKLWMSPFATDRFPSHCTIEKPIEKASTIVNSVSVQIDPIPVITEVSVLPPAPPAPPAAPKISKFASKAKKAAAAPPAPPPPAPPAPPLWLAGNGRSGTLDPS